MKFPATAAWAVLALLACARSSAQQVTVYGLIDTSIEHVTNTNASGQGVWRMPSLTGSLPSRLGFRGSEDLGGGLQAFFVLESGLLIDTGGLNQGNRLFGRAANLGLKGQWGTLTLGRQPNMSFYAYLKADIMGPNLFSLSSVDPYIPNARSDNAIGYLGKFGAWTAGATWSVGRDASASGGPAGTNCPGELASDHRACRQQTAMLAWDEGAGRYGVTAAYDLLRGGPGAGGGLTTSDYSDRRTTLNAYFKLGEARIGGGHIRRVMRTAATQRTGTSFAGVSLPLGPVFVWDNQFVHVGVADSANGASLFATRLTYTLSKRTAVYATAGHVRNRGQSALPVDAGGTAGAGMSQTGVAGGMRLSF